MKTNTTHFTICAVACAFVALINTGRADTTKFQTSCPFQVGDSVEKVKRFYGVAHEPRRLSRITASGSAYEYNFPEFGVRIFFNDDSQVKTIRFDHPFAGKIGGIAIGDSKDTVRRIRGEPAREMKGMPDKKVLAQHKLRRQQLLAALPDPVPKRDVLRVIDELTRLDTTMIDTLHMTAWVYQPASFLRYEFGSITNQVQTILSGSCDSL